MAQLRELDLQLAFEAPRALRENVENEAGTIEDATLQKRFEITFLTRRERVIENDQIGLSVTHERADFFGFAGSHVQTWIRRSARASHDREDFRACGSRERLELVQLILFRSVPQSDTNQECTLTAAGTFKQY